MDDQKRLMDALLRADERIEELASDGPRILQKKAGFRYGMDAVLLADFARIRPNEHVADFGTGTGILPLLLKLRGKGASFDAFEIQPDMADMAARTMQINGCEDNIRVHCMAVEDIMSILPVCSVDAIVCNPPYGVPGSTLLNPSETLRIARHQGENGLSAWFTVAFRILKGKGRLAMVYPAPRMLEAMDALQAAHLVPKRFRLVYPYAERPANLVLIEAVKDARPMLQPEPPLIIHEPDGSETAELQAIYRVSSDAQ